MLFSPPGAGRKSIARTRQGFLFDGRPLTPDLVNKRYGDFSTIDVGNYFYAFSIPAFEGWTTLGILLLPLQSTGQIEDATSCTSTE